MRPKKQYGFTYLALLFTIAIAGILLTRTGIDWTQSGQREKELELIFIGTQFRQAIAQYYHRTPGAIKQYPNSLDVLLADARYSPPQRYLRKIYLDPFTSSQQWGQIMSPEGGITGVHSKSDKIPIKAAGFGYGNESLEGAGKYSDWKFIYVPPVPLAK